jgi:hypothetical protein
LLAVFNSGSVTGGVIATAAAQSCLPLAAAETLLAATIGGESESEAGRAVESVGSDIAFAMAEGTGSKTWIGRARKFFKDRDTRQLEIPLNGICPVICMRSAGGIN